MTTSHDRILPGKDGNGRSHLFFEDFREGEAFQTAGRTITEVDIAGFADLSGDFSPLHMDEAYARSAGFTDRIAHGILVVAVVTGLIASMAIEEGTAVAFLELTWRFKAPVLAGDTIAVRFITRELRPTSRGDRGIMIRDITVVNQRDEVVQEGVQTVLIRRRPVDAEL